MKRYLLCFILLLLASPPVAEAGGGANDTLVYRRPLYFTENAGQWDKDVRYAMLRPSTSAWLCTDGLILARPRTSVDAPGELPLRTGKGRPMETLSIHFVNPSPVMRIVALDTSKAVSHFYLNPDSTGWYEHVHNHRAVRYQNVWDGIDIEYREGEHGGLKQVLRLGAGADASKIAFELRGAGRDEAAEMLMNSMQTKQTDGIEHTRIQARSNADGEALIVVVGAGFTYKDTLNLTTEFNTVFRFGDDSNSSYVVEHAVSRTGEVSVLGQTESPALPVKHAVQDGLIGGMDWFVLRFDSTGRDYTFCTYIGGSGWERSVNGGPAWVENGNGGNYEFRNWILQIDGFGNTYASVNVSEGAPLRADSWKSTAPQSGFGYSAYVFSLSPFGLLRGSTYLGGPGEIMSVGLNVTDSAVYILGGNYLRGVATSTNALMRNKECDSCFAVVLTSLSTDLTREIYTTYLLSGSRAFPSNWDADYITPKFIVDGNGTAVIAFGLGYDRTFLRNPEFRVPGLGRSTFFGLWLAGVSPNGERLEFSSFIPFAALPHGSIQSFRPSSLHRGGNGNLFVSGGTHGAHKLYPVDTIPSGWRTMDLLSQVFDPEPAKFGNWIMKLSPGGEFINGLYYGTSGPDAYDVPFYRNGTCPGFTMFRARYWSTMDVRLVAQNALNTGPLNYYDRYIIDIDEDLNVRYTAHWNAHYFPLRYPTDESLFIDRHGYAYLSFRQYNPGILQEGPGGPYQLPRFHNSWRVPKTIPPNYPSGVDPTTYHDNYLVRFRIYTPCWQVGCGISCIDTLRIERRRFYVEPREFSVDYAVTNHSAEKGARILHALIEVPPGFALVNGTPTQSMSPVDLPSGMTAQCSWTLRVTDTRLISDTAVVRCRVFYVDPESGQTYPPGEELCEHDIIVTRYDEADPNLVCTLDGPDSLYWTGLGYAATPFGTAGPIRYTATFTNLESDTLRIDGFRVRAAAQCSIAGGTLRPGVLLAPGASHVLPIDVTVSRLGYGRVIRIEAEALDTFALVISHCQTDTRVPNALELPCAASGPVRINWNLASGISSPPVPRYTLQLENPLDTIRLNVRAWLDLSSAPHFSPAPGDSVTRDPFTISPAARVSQSWRMVISNPPAANAKDTLYFMYESDGIIQRCFLVVDIVIIDESVICSLIGSDSLTVTQLENRERTQLNYTLSNVGTVPVGISRIDLTISPTAGVLALDPLSQPGGTLAFSGNITRQWRLRPLALRNPRTAHFEVIAYGTADSVLSLCTHDMHIPGIDGLLCDITAPDSLRFIRDPLGYDPDPVPVSLDLRNILDTEETLIEAEIDLTAAPRFELASGETAIKTLSSIDSNSSTQLRWMLHPLADTTTVSQDIAIRYRSLEQAEWKECRTEIIIEAWPLVQTTHCVVSGHDSLHVDPFYEKIIPEPFEASYTATNTGTVALHNCSATISLPPEFELAGGTATVNFGTLNPNQSAIRWWTLNTTAALSNVGMYPISWTWSSDEQGSITGCDHRVHVVPNASSGIVFTPLHLHFEAEHYDPLPVPQYVELWTGGGLSMPWTAQGGQWWINADPVAGDHAARIAVQPTTTALPVGLHATAVRIAGQAPNLPKDVAVTYEITGVVGVEPSATIATFGLGPIWPQPVPLNGEARISVTVPVGEYVRVVLYDALGREVAVLREGALQEQEHILRFSPAAHRLMPGLYLLRMISAGGQAVRRVVVR